MVMQYRDPAGGKESSIGAQINVAFYQRTAMRDAQKEQYFTQLANAKAIPAHFGKKLRMYHYLPLLDDRNVNDQGIDATGAKIANGNLYGSSRDIGTIPDKFPVLGENGGRVNRVGTIRLELEGTFEKFGFFIEYTRDSMNFDTDADLMQHLTREITIAASDMNEDALQIDLINNAGTIVYAGDAAAQSELGADDTLTYGNFMKLAQALDKADTPKKTTILTGTRNIDTRVIPAARYIFCGPELRPALEAMKNLHDDAAFISAEKYAAGTTLANGEVGSIGQFRLIENQKMMKWSGGGAALEAGDEAEYYNTNDRYDVFPLLCVGDESFCTVTFQTSGNRVKFEMNHKRPEDNIDRLDPYGETGFMSMRWYYGFMALRPERIGLIKVTAKL